MNPRKTNLFLTIIASDMPANGKIILLHLLFNAAENSRKQLRISKSEATHERLAAACNASVPTVQRQMKQLLLGSIVVRGNYYQIAIKPKR